MLELTGWDGGGLECRDWAGVGGFDPEGQILSARARYRLAIGIAGRGS